MTGFSLGQYTLMSLPTEQPPGEEAETRCVCVRIPVADSATGILIIDSESIINITKGAGPSSV